MTKSRYEDLQSRIRKLKTPDIEVWANQYADKNYVVDLKTEEFTCFCPKTKLPDFAKLHIQYSPRKYCLELKSFKEYLMFYRSLGIFHEHVVNKILEDIAKAANPRWIRIEGEFNIRGGIKTTVIREYKAK